MNVATLDAVAVTLGKSEETVWLYVPENFCSKRSDYCPVSASVSMNSTAPCA